jgi:hypothetical protein
MNSAKISGLAFSLLFGGALMGMDFSRFLPTEHLIGVQMGIGLLTAMFALLLSLQLSAGKTYFDTQEQDVTLLASRIVLLDSVLAHYGPEAGDAREVLRGNIADLITRVWPNEPSVSSTWTPKDGIGIYDRVQELSPKNDDQQSQRTLALGMVIDLRQISWTSAARMRSSTPVPLMLVEVLWATIIFVSFGLLAPLGLPAIVSLAFCAFAVSSGFFLIEEMNRPFSGVIRVSSAPIREALKYLAQ